MTYREAAYAALKGLDEYVQETGEDAHVGPVAVRALLRTVLEALSHEWVRSRSKCSCGVGMLLTRADFTRHLEDVARERNGLTLPDRLSTAFATLDYDACLGDYAIEAEGVFAAWLREQCTHTDERRGTYAPDACGFPLCAVAGRIERGEA